MVTLGLGHRNVYVSDVVSASTYMKVGLFSWIEVSRFVSI